MSKIVLKITGEDDKVRVKLGRTGFTLSPTNTRNFAAALNNAADHAEFEGHYSNEITIQHKEESDKEQVGFQGSSEETSEKTDEEKGTE